MAPRVSVLSTTETAKTAATNPSSSHEITIDEAAPSTRLEQAGKIAAEGIAASLGAHTDPRQAHLALCDQYGATPERLKAFEETFGAQFIPSASAGKNLASLNDHAGILKIPAYDGLPDAKGPRSVVAEQFAVIKASVPNLDPTVPASERYFVKGYGDRLIDFNELAQAMALHSPKVAQADAAGAAHGKALDERDNKMETPLRSEIKRLSLASVLVARRDDKESDAPVMPLPHNETQMAWREGWANSEAGMSPGGGPMLPNGTRKFQLDYNGTENRLLVFRNEKGDDPRKTSIVSDSLGTPKLAPAWCEGPTLAEIHGIKSWEDMGSALDHKGVKQGNTLRALHAVKEKLTGGKPADPGQRDLELGEFHAAVVTAKPGAHIRITTEDGAVHDLKVDDKGIKLSLANPQPVKAHQESLAAFGGGGKVMADVDVYSYNGRDTGLYGSKTGFADPKLVMSTGESLKAGPLLKSQGSSLAQGALRLVTFQPLINGQDRSRWVARTANVVLNTASKFLNIWATSAINDAMKNSLGGSYMGPGVSKFNASGAGSISQGKLALAAAGIVMAQEVITAAQTIVARVLPEPWKRTPESRLGKVAKEAISPMAEEMMRLMVSMGVQAAVGIQRGSGADFASLAVTSAAKGGIETWREHAGPDRANHPVANALLDLAQGTQYNLSRAAGNAASSPQGLNAATFSEALINRLVTRGLDQIVMPPLKEVLNDKGVVGPNASAFDSQLSHEYRIEDLSAKVGAAMKGMLTELDAQGFKDLHAESGSLMATLHAGTENLLTSIVRKPGGTEFFSARTLSEEQAKQQLNRIDLGLAHPNLFAPKVVEDMSQHLRRTRAAVEDKLASDPVIRSNVTRAGSYAGKGPQEQLQHLHDNSVSHEHRIELARRASSESDEGPSDPAWPSPVVVASPVAGSESYLLASSSVPSSPMPSSAMTNGIDETHKRQQRFTDVRAGAIKSHLGKVDEGADHSGFEPKNRLDRPVPSMVNVDFGLKNRPFGAGRSAAVPRAQTTFSTLPQSKTYEKNRQMAQQPGMDSVASKPDPVKLTEASLPPSVLNRIEKAVRDYTVESQLFHYPLRWQVTGEVQREQVAPGIDVPYNVMHKRGNTAGSKKDKVDPIEALYVNLGARVSDKFPAEMYRAVVTEAAYKQHLEGGEKMDSPGLMTEGNKGVLTEIFSATMEPKMAAGFNLPISNYGSAPRENSLRIVLNQESGVNIAKWADLVQGEVIMMPGAVLQVEHVDPTAGKGATKGAQDIGQVVYMKAVDTYALELAHDAFTDYKNGVAGAKAPEDGAVMIDPKSGHFYKFNAEADEIKAVSETKNYFTGAPLENTSSLSEQARWRQPYTGDYATRATKDAIHMAVLRNDPIVPYLDVATENVHHAFFRDKARMGGNLNEVREQAEIGEKNRVRSEARSIGQHIAEMNTGAPVQEQGTSSTEMLAWLATSLLRKPIQLVPVDDSGAAPKLAAKDKSTVINVTYDKVQLQNQKQATSRNPEAAILIGVGEKGYYAVSHRDGSFAADARIGKDKSVGNLLHAVMRGGYATPSQYVEQSGVLTPDTRAQASVDGLLQKMQQFAGTDYLVLQEAMVRKQSELTAAADPKGKGKAQE